MQGLPISLALLFHHIRTYDRPHDLGVYRTCVLERSSQMGDDMQEVASPQRELLDCNRSYPSTFKSSNKAREPGFEPGISACVFAPGVRFELTNDVGPKPTGSTSSPTPECSFFGNTRY